MDRTNRHLKEKLGYSHYQRRVPKRYASFDPRGVIECSLRTKSLEIARMRRDAMEESDDLYWAMLAGTAGDTGSPENLALQLGQAQRRYQAAQTRALVRGFVYAPVEHLASEAALVDRVPAHGVTDRPWSGVSGGAGLISAPRLAG